MIHVIVYVYNTDRIWNSNWYTLDRDISEINRKNKHTHIKCGYDKAYEILLDDYL